MIVHLLDRIPEPDGSLPSLAYYWSRKESRESAAKRLGVNPGRITQLCRQFENKQTPGFKRNLWNLFGS